MTEEELQAELERHVTRLVEKHGPRELAAMVLELQGELAEQSAIASMYEEDTEVATEAHKALADVRDHILKGDTEWAIELIGREIGY